MGRESQRHIRSSLAPLHVISTIEDARHFVDDLVRSKSLIGSFVFAETEGGRKMIPTLPSSKDQLFQQYERAARILQTTHPTVILVVVEVWYTEQANEDRLRKDAVKIFLLTAFSIRSALFSREQHGLSKIPMEECELSMDELDPGLRIIFDTLHSWGTVH